MSLGELKVLFIEDSVQDRELEERELRKAGIAFRSLCVDNLPDLKRALAEFKPDVIISDYHLPTTDGLTALDTVRAADSALPFIFVSGTLGEERAVAALKRGATDYVVKGRLRALPHAVERAVKEARNRHEKEQAEADLRQAQKMEAIGRLAGGIAHDFNNLLTAITGYTEIAKAGLGAAHPAGADLDEVLKASRRAASLTRQLLAFSRKQLLQPRVLDLNGVVSDMEKLLRRVIGEDVALVSALHPSPVRVRADAGQVEQVLLNLAVNARDAMPQGGTITLRTGFAELGPDFSARHPGTAPGRHAVLSVADTGVGMTEEVRAHLFEPFFTTKAPGAGTGLGLSTVYGIVTQSGGAIEVQTLPGRGSTFEVYLPSVEQAVDGPSAGPARAGSTRGTETVLVVEDAQSVRHLVRAVLTSQGYSVLEAPEAATAKSLFTVHERPIHLLLTDLILPGMNGQELARELRAARGDLKVLYMSGYAEEQAVQEGLVGPDTSFLPKPFTPLDLLQKLREVLGPPAPN